MPTKFDIKAFEKDFARHMQHLEKRREDDQRKFQSRGKAGAYLTHDILSDRKGLTQRKKLVMAYGFQGLTKEYDLKTLHKMAEATEKAQDKYKSREAGIPIAQAIQGSDIEDKRLAKRIAGATLYMLTGNLLDFRVTSSGDTPNAPSYYRVRVRLEDWKNEVSKVKAKDYMTAAQRATMGYVSFDCNCGRYIYYYQYLATIGNFDIAPGETVFPKIKNRRLKGICCKHILKALMTVQSPIIQRRVSMAMQATAVDKDFEKIQEVRLTAKELEEMEQAGYLTASTQAEYKRFLTAVKKFNEKQKQLKTKKIKAEHQDNNEAKMKQVFAEKKALEAEFKKNVVKQRELIEQVKIGHLAMLKTLKQGGFLNDTTLETYATNAKVDKETLMQIAKDEGLL